METDSELTPGTLGPGHVRGEAQRVRVFERLPLVALLLLLALAGCGLLRPAEDPRERADREWRERTEDNHVPEEPSYACIKGRVASDELLGQPLRNLEVLAFDGDHQAGVCHTDLDGLFRFCVSKEARPWGEQLAEGVFLKLLGIDGDPSYYKGKLLQLRLEIRAAGFQPWSRMLPWDTSRDVRLDDVLLKRAR